MVLNYNSDILKQRLNVSDRNNFSGIWNGRYKFKIFSNVRKFVGTTNTPSNFSKVFTQLKKFSFLFKLFQRFFHSVKEFLYRFFVVLFVGKYLKAKFEISPPIFALVNSILKFFFTNMNFFRFLSALAIEKEILRKLLKSDFSFVLSLPEGYKEYKFGFKFCIQVKNVGTLFNLVSYIFICPGYNLIFLLSVNECVEL